MIFGHKREGTDKVKNLTFITGGVRSGKSILAEDLAAEAGRPVYYLATMRIFDGDPEQLRRLEIHRSRRPADWQTVDAAFDAHDVVSGLPAGEATAIFDCLSLYVTNILLATADGVDIAYDAAGPSDPYLKETEVLQKIGSVLAAMEQRPEIDFVVVSNEVGWGVVPESSLGRCFRDFLGLANQEFAARARRVYLACSGLRLQLK